jgi:hypothetical protein
MKAWFDKLDRTQSKRFHRILNLHAQKERGTPLLKTLIDEGLVSKDEVDIRNLIGSYSRRVGEDIANARIRNALESDKLIKQVRFRDERGKPIKGKEKRSKWPKLDPIDFPMYKDYAVHPVVRDYMMKYRAAVGDHSMWEQAMNTTKMFQFYNPVILPMYDTYQTAMLQWTHPHQVPSNFIDGFKSYLRGDEDYWSAARNGLFSKPYANPMSAHKLEVDKAKYGALKSYLKSYEVANLPMKERLTKVMKGISIESLRSIYNISWDMAWKGDAMLRMVSYKALKKRGFSDREAAQMAALFHGDYASVPPQTRKFLNKIFFTPTFKVAMGKAQAEMTKSAVDSFIKYGQFKLPDNRTRTMAAGLVGALAANWAKDMLLTNLGFERDQWGRRYYREVETDEGPKEINVTMSDPTNVLLKYMQSTYGEIADFNPSEKTLYGRIIGGFRHEVHPALKIGLIEMVTNEKWDGTRIYSGNDPKWRQGLKSLEYFAGQVVPLMQLAGVGDRDQPDQEIIKEDFGAAWDKISRLVVYPYVSEPRISRAKHMVRQIKKDIFSDIERGAYTEERQQNAMERIRKLEEYIHEQQQ